MKTNTEINGNKYYRITRTVGHAPDGSPVRKQFYGASKKQAEDKYKEYLLATAKVGASDSPLSLLAEQYVEHVLKVSQKYAQGTIDLYVGAYNNHVKDAPVMDKRADKVTSLDLQTFYNSLDVSQQTLKRVHKFMRGFWKWLVLNGYAPDLLSAVEMPRKTDNTKHESIIMWEENEVRQILDALEKPQKRHRLTFMIYVLLYTGMRISEVLALKYSDFNDVIHVERQYYLKEIKEPKFGSKRMIPMHDVIKEQLPPHRKWHMAEAKKRGYKTDFVFTTSEGKLYDRSSVRKALERFYKANGIPYKHIHAYRATFCTQMCRCDVPLEIASKILGHKSMEVTAQHYALVRQDDLEKNIVKFHY